MNLAPKKGQMKSEFKMCVQQPVVLHVPIQELKHNIFFIFLFSVDYITQATWLDRSWSSSGPLSSYENLR